MKLTAGARIVINNESFPLYFKLNEANIVKIIQFVEFKTKYPRI